jgi:hypothetical protein
MESDALLSRVRKLLAMAESEELSEQARESYNAKAADLIARYGIDQALLAERAGHRAAAADLEIDVDAPYARDKVDLLAAVALALGCRLVRASVPRPGGGIGHRAHLFGMSPDLERTQLLYTSLLVQQALGLAAARVPLGEDARAFRRSWMAGFAMAVGTRLRAAEQRARAEYRAAPETRGRGVDLVLADRSALVNARMASVYPRLRTSGPRRLSGSGLDEGARAGQRADIGTGRVGSARGRGNAIGPGTR